MPVQAQTRVGDTLGNYRLIKLLGSGGYAEVYLAENVHLGIQTAIKILKLRDLDPLAQEKFRSEAKFMTTLKHRYIIGVLDYGIEMSQRGSDGSTPYLVMEYAPLGTLRHLYSHNTPMPLPKILLYTKQVGEALQYAHDKNITHLDIKPENMLVSKPENAALSDFGIAVTGLNSGNLQLQQDEILQKMARGEQVGVAGTAPYLAPERLKGYTQRASDQYSLAVVVYEWLSGKRPFEGSSDLEICRKHVEETPPPLNKINPLNNINPHISREIEQVVMKALSKEPTNRYASVAEFVLTLENALHLSLPPTSSILSTPQTPVRPWQPVVVPVTPAVSPIVYPVTPAVSPIVQPVTPVVAPVTPRPTSFPSNFVGGNQGQVPIRLPGSGPSLPGEQDLTEDFKVIISEPQTSPPSDVVSSILTGMSAVINKPITTTKKIFVSDQYFVRTKKTRQFLLLGVPVNFLSILIVAISGPLPASVLVALIGGAAAIAMLWRCAVSVKKPIAMMFGVGIALWWGYVVASAVGHLPYASITTPSYLLACSISIIIHVWYVNNKLK